MTTQKQKVRDENGNIYASMKDASVAYGFLPDALRKVFWGKGDTISYKGHTFTKVSNETEQVKNIKPLKEETPAPVETKEKEGNNEALLNKIVLRYSPDELALLAKGEGLQDKRLRYQIPHLYGKHFRVGVISDGHLGSKFAPVEWHELAFEAFEKAKCSCILHCGDMVEGLKRARADTQIYELSHIGYKAQRDLAVEVFSKTKLPIYAISGNHDGFFNDSGANIVEDIASRVPNMTYLGEGTADMYFDGVIVRLHHGGDGNSYALSYRLQKLIESYSGGKKPNILLAGHVHKYCHIFERNIQAVSVPTLQMQTPWMQQKKLAAHTGFLIIEFDVKKNQLCNFTVKLFPFYE